MEPTQVDITQDEVLDDGVGQDLVNKDARWWFRCWEQVSLFDGPPEYRVYRFDGVRWSRVGDNLLRPALAYCGASSLMAAAPAAERLAAGLGWALSSWRRWRQLCEALDQFYQK